MSVAVPTVVSTLYRKGIRNTMMFAPKPLNPDANKFVGVAFTVRTIPTREDLVEAQAQGKRPNLQAEASARVAAGEVLVVAMDGETRTAFMGDIMATHFLAKGVAGVVLDGGVSDAAAIARIPLPLFCCGPAGLPVTSHRLVVELQVPVGCAGVAVFPGDVIFGDANGIVCIPKHLAEEVAQVASEREQLEEWVIARVREGRPLAGTYPPNEATIAEYNAWRAAQPRK
jgi:regulator of RNase E activity RraA